MHRHSAKLFIAMILLGCSDTSGGGGTSSTTGGGGAGGASTTASSSSSSSSAMGGTGGQATTSTSGSGGNAATCASRWSKGVVADGSVDIPRSTVDPQGNIIATGVFYGAVDLGGGPLLDPNGNAKGAFVAKLDCEGSLLWSKVFSMSAIESVTTDATGAIFVAGGFTGQADFGLGPVTAPHGAVFVTKLEASGNVAWVRSYACASCYSPSHAVGIAVAPSGHLYFTAYADDPLDFGGGLVGDGPLGPGLYAVELDASGTHVWSKGFGWSINGAIALDPSGDLVLCATPPTFVPSLDFGGGILPAGGIVLARLSSSGQHIWSKSFTHEMPWPPAQHQATCSSVAIDASGAIVIGGIYTGPATVDFGGGPVSISGPDQLLIAKFTSAGASLFVKLPGAGDTLGTAHPPYVAVDAASNIFVTGVFSSPSIDFGTGPLVSANPDATYDLFVARLGPTGVAAWAKAYGDAYEQKAQAIAVGPNGMPVISGRYMGSPDLGDGAFPAPPNDGSFNAFLAKLPP